VYIDDIGVIHLGLRWSAMCRKPPIAFWSGTTAYWKVPSSPAPHSGAGQVGL